MISIVICGINPDYKLQIEQNITQTIGSNYEIFYHDNTLQPKSIATVYNFYLKIANGEYICFCHEDVKFTTQNWGIKLKEIFNTNEQIGLIGLAGAFYKSKTPSSWAGIGLKYLSCNYTQQYKTGEREKVYHQNIDKFATEVVCIDGFFMCLHGNLKSKITFNESILNSFHGYDLDLSLQVLKNNRKIIVTNQFSMIHFSEGTMNLDWYKTHKKLIHFWKNHLPIQISSIKNNEVLQIEYAAFHNGLNYLIKSKSYFEIIIHFISYFKFNFIIHYFIKK